jgi:hypothetical protein
MAVFFRRLNVDAMLRSLTAKQFMEWEAFFSLEPWTLESELRADYRAASIRQTIYNSQVTKKSDLKELSHFLIPFEQEEKKQKSPEELLNIAKVLAFTQNAIVAAGADEENALERARAAMIKVSDRVTFKDM